MRIVFLGTPDVAVPALQAFLDAPDVEVVAVITNPDRPRGRSKTLVAPPVKEAAVAAGVPVWQPQRPRDVLDDLRAVDVDACAVVAYGALLPADVLAAGGAGFVNLHFSLLPRWRGAAPVQHAIRAGDAETGISTFVLDEGMDTGPLLDQVTVPIDPAETSGELLDRLADLGAAVLVDSIRRLVDGVEPQPQDPRGATLAPKIVPDDVRIDFGAPARTVVDLIRSANPAPGAHTTWDGDRFKVHRAHVPAEPDTVDATVDATDDDVAPAQPGTLAVVDGDLLVWCADGPIILDVVQPPGKGRMDAAAWANGARPDPGSRLGS